jgi:hypothetical protein
MGELEEDGQTLANLRGGLGQSEQDERRSEDLEAIISELELW